MAFISTFKSTIFSTFLWKSTFKSAKNSTLKSTICSSDPICHTPHEHHPSDRIFRQRPKCDFSFFPLVFLDQLFLYMIKPSSVTKRNIMDWIGKGLGIVYTPHQCRYSDRKSPF